MDERLKNQTLASRLVIPRAISVFVHPMSALESSKANASLWRSFLPLLILCSLVLLVAIADVFVKGQSNEYGGLGYIAHRWQEHDLMGILFFYVVVTLLAPMISGSLSYSSAKFLGGRGDFLRHLYQFSMVFSGYLVFALPIFFLMLLFVQSGGGSNVYLLFGGLLLLFIYALHSLYLVTRNLHGISTGRSLLVVFTWMLVQAISLISAAIIAIIASLAGVNWGRGPGIG